MLLWGGDEGGMFDPRHWVACDATLTVVIVVIFALASLLFCSAIFSRLERLGFDGNCVVELSPDIDIAVDSEP